MSADDDAGELIATATTHLYEEDLVRAYRNVPLLRQILWGPVVGVGAVSLVGTVVFAMEVTRPGLVVVFAALCCAFVTVLALVRWRLPRAQWRATPEHARELRFEVRSRRFRTRTDRSTVD